MLDVNKLPTSDQLSAAFKRAAAEDEVTAKLLQVYETGVMYEDASERVELNNTSLDFGQGLVLWYLAQQLKPEKVVETGFGRGGSAAFFLVALNSWEGKVISLDPAFRHWAGDIGENYIKALGALSRHEIIEEASEFALPELIKSGKIQSLTLSYIDGSHHFDGTLFDFMFLDKVTPVGGVIAIDDAHAPAVRTVSSFVVNNLPYKVHYPTPRLAIFQKTSEIDREWDHFRPFVSSRKVDWDVHADPPSEDEIPNATFA